MFAAHLLEIARDWTLPALIFSAEIVVVTLATIRIIFLARGMKTLASLIGLFEVSIWLFAIGQIMKNLSDLRCFAAFAGGFTLGNYLGVAIHDYLAIGHVLVRIITGRNPNELITAFKSANFGVTCVDGTGAMGPVQIVLTAIKRRDLKPVLELIQKFDSRAFYSVEDLHSTAEGVYPVQRHRPRHPWFFIQRRKESSKISMGRESGVLGSSLAPPGHR